jgi:hypothetical protein
MITILSFSALLPEVAFKMRETGFEERPRGMILISTSLQLASPAEPKLRYLLEGPDGHVFSDATYELP